ncbi:arsenate reductase family protein [Effusibacillus consociatus]|uniref:Arsenate reductase family protein n=2 Tax=Effusibacillus consociatus TaxID=1117041 RepID=A0ABV9Q853_9BACL
MLNQEEVLEIARSLGIRVHELLRPNSPVYKERKEELLAMDEKQLSAVIATEPTLIKRPIVKADKGYVIGLDADSIRRLVGADEA